MLAYYSGATILKEMLWGKKSHKFLKMIRLQSFKQTVFKVTTHVRVL